MLVILRGTCIIRKCICWTMFDITVYAYIISFVIDLKFDFGLFSRELVPGKKLEEKFTKVIFAKKNFSKIAKVFSKFEKPKIRGDHKEKCGNI